MNYDPTKLRKLVRLANFLDDLPHSRFHMPRWCSPDATEDSCGTAGCACGWAATIFKGKGWKLTAPDPADPGCRGNATLVLPDGSKPGPIDSFAGFFGITITDALIITCSWDEYWYVFKVSADEITPRIAADMIRLVVRKYDVALPDEELEPLAVPVALTGA